VVLSSEREDGLSLVARFADVHLLDEARPDRLAEAVAQVTTLAGQHSRSVTTALRLGVVARDFEAEARRDLSRASGAAQDGVLWSLPTAKPGVGFDVSPTGWRARHAIVGSYETVAEQLRAYVELGVDTFVLEGIHPVADAYRFGEYVQPLFHRALASA